MTQNVRELELVESLVAGFPRSPLQCNRVQESDAELVSLKKYSSGFLAITTDGIVEEIESGLYADPYLIGWMTVVSSLSDLAAVGAEPVGLLIAETLSSTLTPRDLTALQTGIRDACVQCGSAILGGDTNVGSKLHMVGTAVGIISDGPPMTRKGCKVGDALYCTGPLGTGNAFAATRFFETGCQELEFLPKARIAEGQTIRPIASACMDTSDGLFATLDQLGRLNTVGFELAAGWEDAISTGAQRLASATHLSHWMLLAGPHGEFELVFTVPPDREFEVAKCLNSEGRPFRQIGKVVREMGVRLEGLGYFHPDQLATLRNKEIRNGSDVRNFLAFLVDLESRVRTSTNQ